MKKELKNYLHFYLGGNVKCIKGNQHLLRENGISTGQVFKLTSAKIFTCTVFNDAFKLILRPISDMTWDEAKEYFDLPKNSELVERVVHHHFIEFDYRFVHENPKLNIEDGYCYSGVAVGFDFASFTNSPEKIRWLLNTGFDIFGLIEENLALKIEKPIDSAKELSKEIEKPVYPEIIMLPSNSETDGAIMWFENKIGHAGEYNPIHARNGCIRQHLYAISQDDIKQGDTCLTIFKTIVNAEQDCSPKTSNLRKIVASTDKKVTPPEAMIEDSAIDSFIATYNLNSK